MKVLFFSCIGMVPFFRLTKSRGTSELPGSPGAPELHPQMPLFHDFADWPTRDRQIGRLRFLPSTSPGEALRPQHTRPLFIQEFDESTLADRIFLHTTDTNLCAANSRALCVAIQESICIFNCIVRFVKQIAS